MSTSDALRMPPTIHTVRHGETAWSLSGQHTGITDLALTPNGEDQARALAPVLANTAFAHVLTSPLRRARETCALAGLGATAIIEPDLIEWNYGDYEGKRSAEIRAHRPDWSVFRDGCPGGETPDQIARRADRLIVRLRTLTGNVALFGHGQFGRCLAARWIDLALCEARRLKLDTASLGILGHDQHHQDTCVIALWNFVPRALTPDDGTTLSIDKIQ